MHEHVFTLQDIDTVARDLLADYGAPRSDHAVLWALKGDLGAGKTTLVQAVARQLGVTETVTSPTFILLKSYPLTSQPFERLVHIDAYRLEDPNELTPLRLQEFLADPGNLVLLEWPERAGDLLPADAQRLELTIVDEQTRRLTYGS